MKALLAVTLVCGFILTSQAQALPEAKSLNQRKPISIVSIPGYTKGFAGLAVSFEFGNPCSASAQDVFVSQDETSISVYSAYTTDLVCTAHYEPTIRWSVVAQNLKIGEKVLINGQAVVVETPTAAICIQTVCQDGSQRDTYTCSCADGYVN